ncbi:MAG: transcriptional regulator GutM [Bacillota bacterium]
MGMEKMVLIVFGMIFVQGIFTFVQIKNYNKKIREMKQYGMVGIGMKKGRLSSGNIILLAVDKEGTVVRCERMKGISVFARFKQVNEMTGIEIGELKKKILQNVKYNKKGIAKPDPLKADWLFNSMGMEMR